VSAARFPTLLDWHRRADELCAQARAASATAPGEPSVAMLWLGESMVAAQHVTVDACRSTEVPGTLVSMTAHSLGVATASHDVMLRQFLTTDGRALTVPQLVEMSRIREGTVMPLFSRAALDAAVAGACSPGEEAQWLDDWRDVKPIGAPLPSAGARETSDAGFVVLAGVAQRVPPHTQAAAFALAVLLVWLARSAAAERFDVGLRFARTDLLPGAHHLLAGTRPFRVEAEFSQPFDQFSRDCCQRLAAWQTRKPYPRAAVMRDPRLLRPPGCSDFASWPVAIELPASGEGRYRAPDLSRGLTFAITAGSGDVRVRHGGWRVPQREWAAAQLATLAQDCVARPGTPLGRLALLPSTDAATLREEVWGR
jgi:surfactin family lipopeptide synthetase A